MSMLLLRQRDKPALDLSFMGVLPSCVSFSRASSKWRFNENGNLEEVTANLPAFDYDPLTKNLNGMLLEEQRTNSVRNSAANGASVGSPGTLPTNWSINNNGGLSVSVAATGVEYGMSYVDLRFAGTSTNTFMQIVFETSNAIPAVQNETWTNTLYIRQSAGSAVNVTNYTAQINEYNSSYGYLASGNGSAASPSATLTRINYARTLSNASTAYVRPIVNITIASGVLVDITLRLYQPQMEKGAFASSPIVTAGSAVTRAADSAAIAPLGSWFKAASGSLEVETLRSASFVASTYPRLASFNDNTASNEIGLAGHYSGYLFGYVQTNGAYQAQSNNGAWTLNVVQKLSMRYGTNDEASCSNGGVVATDTSVTLPTVNQLQFFGLGTGANFKNNGWLRRFRYWYYGLDDATLQRVTQ